MFYLKYIPLISLDLVIQKTALSKGFKNPSLYKKELIKQKMQTQKRSKSPDLPLAGGRD